MRFVLARQAVNTTGTAISNFARARTNIFYYITSPFLCFPLHRTCDLTQVLIRALSRWIMLAIRSDDSVKERLNKSAHITIAVVAFVSRLRVVVFSSSDHLRVEKNHKVMLFAAREIQIPAI